MFIVLILNPGWGKEKTKQKKKTCIAGRNFGFVQRAIVGDRECGF